MKDFIFYEEREGKTYSHTLKAKDHKEAVELSRVLGYELKGVRVKVLLIDFGDVYEDKTN